jgi:DNA invertase Pin-like site-specific DNA recombinase
MCASRLLPRYASTPSRRRANTRWRRRLRGSGGAPRIAIIDADLGVSGRTASARSGFKELVGRVCVGEVGAILGLEVSRLARSSADLQRLLELCALTDTLIIDSDGIYDLGSFNDRLLLGLKGTMSEAELHLTRKTQLGTKTKCCWWVGRRGFHGLGVGFFR